MNIDILFVLFKVFIIGIGAMAILMMFLLGRHGKGLESKPTKYKSHCFAPDYYKKNKKAIKVGEVVKIVLSERR